MTRVIDEELQRLREAPPEAPRGRACHQRLRSGVLQRPGTRRRARRHAQRLCDANGKPRLLRGRPGSLSGADAVRRAGGDPHLAAGGSACRVVGSARRIALQGVTMSRLAIAAVLLAPTLAVAQPPDRSTAPVPGPAPVLTLPVVQQARLSNGLAVRLVEMHEVPVVRIVLVFRNGAVADPAGKPGVASLTAAMLDEGAGSRSALEISDEAAFLGASLATGSSYDASFVSVGRAGRPDRAGIGDCWPTSRCGRRSPPRTLNACVRNCSRACCRRATTPPPSPASRFRASCMGRPIGTGPRRTARRSR